MAEEREAEIEGGRILYSVFEGEITIQGCRPDSGSIHFPDMLEGLPITVIGRKAFLGAKTLQQIWLPAGTKEIGDWAFAHCSKLRELWLPGKEIKFGKGVFKDDTALAGIYRFGETLRRVMPGAEGKAPSEGRTDQGGRQTPEDRPGAEGKTLSKDRTAEEEKQIGRLLGAVPVKLEADYLLLPKAAGTPEWLEQFDRKLREFLAGPDQEGYSRVIYCGEEDLMASIELYLDGRRREKARLCFLRLINALGLSEKLEEELLAYIREHTKGCGSEEAWKVVFEEHGGEQAYYETLLRAGGVNEENYDGILLEMGERFPEMKGYLMRAYGGAEAKPDFFDELSLDF